MSNHSHRPRLPLPIKSCLHCQKEFGAKAFHLNRGGDRQKFCSKQCCTLFARRHRIERTCEKCGKQFRVPPSVLKHNATRFCSQKCAGTARERFFKVCEWCQDDFEINRARLNTARYCSILCHNRAIGFSNTKYPLDAKSRCGRKKWRKRRLEILNRDGWKCTQCGSQTKLCVHHIVRWRETRDDSPENLITLCKSCHVKIEPTPIMKQTKRERVSRLARILID